MIRPLKLIVLLLVPLALTSAEITKHFEQITTNDGLSQSWVRTIHQDQLGYIWLGTADGLNRYDGRSFVQYMAGDAAHPGLRHSSINYIMQKSEWELWVCTDLGVSIYNYHTDSFEAFPYILNRSVEVSLKDRDGYIWFGTDNGLFRFNPVDSSLSSYLHSNDNPQSLSYNRVRSMYQDAFGNIWIGTQRGLNLYNPSNDSFTRYLPTSEPWSISGEDIWAITQDNEGRLWIGVALAGLDLFDNYHQRPQEGRFREILPGSINRLAIDYRNQLWVGKGGGEGLVILDLESVDSHTGIRYTNHIHSPEDFRGLSDNTIASLYLDSNNDMWVGTFGGGVNFYSQRTKQFNNVGVSSDLKRSISGQLVNSFYDEDAYLWVGTEMGLDRLDKRTGKFKSFPYDPQRPNSIGGKCIYSIAKDSKGNLWIGAWGGGLNRYNYRTGTFTTYLPDGSPRSINSPNVFSLLEDSKGNLWVGTIGGGLNQYNYQTRSFSNYTHNPNDPESIHNNSVNHIMETSAGELMLTVYSAFHIFDPETGRFKQFVHNPDDPSSISSGFKLSVFEDSRMNIWVATNMGLNLLHRDSGTFTHYTRRHGLPNNTIQAILEDDHGNLWVSTNKGLAKFINGVETPKDPVFKVFDRRDGLPSDEFTLRAAFKNKEGWMFFGTSQGYTYFHPDSIKANHIPPPVIINGIELIASHPNTPPLKLPSKNLNSIDELRLNYRQNSFIIHFSALNYVNPKKNQYKFRLGGYETEWRDIGNSQTATYTNINPGTYTFMVMGSNNDGVWSEEPRTLRLVITPPWWGTFIFKASVVLIILTGVWYAIRMRLRILEKQKRVLEQNVQERTVELSIANNELETKQAEITKQNEELSLHRNHLEQLINERTAELEEAKEKAEVSDKLKTAFLSNMSHEIRTPMNAIVGFSSLLTKPNLRDDEKKQYLEIINGNSESLLLLINDILDVSLIESNQLSIEKKWFSVKGVMLDIENYYHKKNSKNVEIKFVPDKKLKDLNLYTDPVRFRQVLSNLLSNAYKYTDAGHIHFGYQILNGKAQFFVSDTGIGIDRRETKNIFDHFYKVEKHESKLYRGTGIGLSICKKLVSLMDGTIWVESVLGSGSIFFFTIPLDSPEKERVEKPIAKSRKPKSYKLNGITVLVAEDEPANFMLIDHILADTGCKVVWARNGYQAVEFIKSNPKIERCVVLMDIKMPVMDGYQAKDAIRKINAKVPIIAVTAYALTQDELTITQAQFNGYIPKPINSQQVIEAIAQSVG